MRGDPAVLHSMRTHPTRIENWAQGWREHVLDAIEAHSPSYRVLGYGSPLGIAHIVLSHVDDRNNMLSFDMNWFRQLALIARPDVVLRMAREIDIRVFDALVRLVDWATFTRTLCGFIPCACPSCCPPPDGKYPRDMGFGGPLCMSPLCRREGPHYPREYGCRWSQVHIDGKTCDDAIPPEPLAYADQPLDAQGTR